MIRAFLHTSGTISILSIWVLLPRVSTRIVLLHRWAFLCAHSIIIKILACEAVALLGAGAAAGAEEVAALARVGAEAAALEALGAAVDLGEALAVVRALSPAAALAARVARRALARRRREVVLVHQRAVGARDDLVPHDRPDVAQVVVVDDAHAARQDVPERGHLERVHLGEDDHERELLLVHVDLEERAAADDLQLGQHDAAHVDVRDEHVAGDLADAAQEAQVHALVLHPRQLQVAVHVRAVGVALAQVAVVVLAVRRHRQPPIRADANSLLGAGAGQPRHRGGQQQQQRRRHDTRTR